MWSLWICSFVVVLSTGTTLHVNTTSPFRLYVDDSGRTRLFHGINIDQKSPPYYPTVPDDVLKNYTDILGFQLVRLDVEWRAVEPARGEYNDTYLSHIKEFAQRLAAQGLWYYLDFHQDTWGYALCGNGAPEWATILTPQQYKEFPLPTTEKPCKTGSDGKPICSSCPPEPGNWWGAKYFTFADNAAFGNLYTNAKGVQDAWVAMLAHTAAFMKDLPYLFGYELINEPWMGDIYKDPRVLLETGYSDRVYLQPMYEKAAAAVRAQDAKHFIMYEPTTRDTQLFPFGSGFTQGPGGPSHNNMSVFSWHHYCPLSAAPNGTIPREICDNYFADTSFRIHCGDGMKLGGGLVLSEFGAVGGDVLGVHEVNYILRLADQYFQSWTYWDYNSLHHAPKLQQAVARPYPIAVAGVPLSYTFDPDTRKFHFEWMLNPKVNEPTEVFTGAVMWYGGNPHITVTPPNVVTFTTDSARSRMYMKPGPAAHMDVMVTVVITP